MRARVRARLDEPRLDLSQQPVEGRSRELVLEDDFTGRELRPYQNHEQLRGVVQALVARRVRGVLVVGGGPGGYPAAIRAGQLGLDTIIVDKHGLGGTCLNRGCIPSKAFIHAASKYEEMVHHAQKDEMGLKVSDPTLDMAGVTAWKDGIVSKLTKGVGQLIKAAKVEAISGWATFKNAKTCLVEMEDGETVEITAENVILATGSCPCVDAIPVLRDAAADFRLPVDASGLPALEETLTWGDERFFVVGVMAALRVGPDAGNLTGARRAADICAAHLGCHDSLLEEGNVLANMYAAFGGDSESGSESESSSG